MTANGERQQDGWKAATLERSVIFAGRVEHFLKCWSVSTLQTRTQEVDRCCWCESLQKPGVLEVFTWNTWHNVKEYDEYGPEVDMELWWLHDCLCFFFLHSMTLLCVIIFIFVTWHYEWHAEPHQLSEWVTLIFTWRQKTVLCFFCVHFLFYDFFHFCQNLMQLYNPLRHSR